jgi:hypothetical protein
VAQATNNTDLILAGTYWGDDLWLLRLDSTGNLVTERAYPAASSETDYLGSVAAAADGGGVASRSSQSFGAGDYDAFLMKFDANLSFPDTDCDGGYDPVSEIDDMTFVKTDITALTHELDYTTNWTTADDTTTEADPGFLLWYCAEDADEDADGVYDYEDNCPLTENEWQDDGDGDGYGNACDCDMDNSGAVNQLDFMQFRSVWGTDDETADFNADGVVNQMDFSILRFDWGSLYPWY